ncbi:MAG: transcription termination factor Rho, partial [Gemmatimonadetes bacterium]|nr:transcription termination factor Rho [Gemmatimonadota bacterium]
MSLSTQPTAAARPAAASQPADGILEVLPSGSGFLRTAAHGYQAADGDVFVSQSVIRRLGLRTGDRVQGTTGTPPGRGKSSPLDEVITVNGLDPALARGRVDFGSLPASYPDERLKLEIVEEAPAGRGRRDYTNRIIDLISPLGKGQRALIVAPAKAGKTTVLQAIMRGVHTNYPDAALMVLLVDERPEEVTEMQMLGIGEVIASSFDCPAERHVAVAEMVLEHARRLVESGRDVVIVLDSLTRLARAYN